VRPRRASAQAALDRYNLIAAVEKDSRYANISNAGSEFGCWCGPLGCVQAQGCCVMFSSTPAVHAHDPVAGGCQSDWGGGSYVVFLGAVW
jgi:hypothetical protein